MQDQQRRWRNRDRRHNERINEPIVPCNTRVIAYNNNDDVCLVEKQDGRLGFPKRGHGIGDQPTKDTALREWRGEAGPPTNKLRDTTEHLYDGPLWLQVLRH